MRQLLLFGFPPPGHPYWTEQTLRDLAVRYPGLDTSPWRVQTVNNGAVTEEDAQLELLKVELNSVQEGIRGLDTIAFQIKGWSVTVSLAIGGFAASSRQPALALIGIVALIGFFGVDCQFKGIQRAFIDRNKSLDTELRTVGIMPVLQGAGTLKITGTAVPDFYRQRRPGRGRTRHFLLSLWHEARLANTFGLYLFLLLCLIGETIILLAAH
jgi:hypothetical protein